MDGKSEGLQDLGTFGILKESWRVLQYRTKLLGTITLSLILPLCFASLLHALISIPLLLKIFSNEIFIPTGQVVDEEWASRELCRQLTEFLLMEAAYSVFSFATWIVSTSAVVYTVASFYTAKHEPSFGRVMRFASLVWKRLAFTSLWFLIVLVGILLAYGSACFVFIWLSRLANNVYGDIFMFVGLVTCMASVVHVSVYAGMTWQMASVASVLEEKYYGWAAMRRGHELMGGKRRTAMWLTVLYLMIQGVYWCGVVRGNWEIATSCAYGTFLVVAECGISVGWALSQSVLYFVCKNHRCESIDEWFLVEGICEYLPVSSADVEAELKN